MNCLRISVSLLILVFLTVTEIHAQVKSSPSQNAIEGGGGSPGDPHFPPCGNLNSFPAIIGSPSIDIQGNTANISWWWRNNGATDYDLNADNETFSGGCNVHYQLGTLTGGGPTTGLSSCTVSGIPLGHTVEFYVSSSRDCIDQFGDETTEEKDSNPVSIGLPPAPPTGLVSSAVSPISFKASWTASSGATSYLVDVFTDYGATVVTNFPASGTSVVVSSQGIYANNTYNFSVRAVNSTGASGYSATSSITIFAPTIVATPEATLKYEQPAGITLTTQAGHTGYAWTYNGSPVSGPTPNSLQVTKTGVYTAKWCASYSDGTTQCLTESLTVNGEVMNVNYVQKRMPQVGNIKTVDQLNALTNSDLITITDYVDGLARPIQHVERGSSPLGKDVVTTSRYDAFSRTPKQFLPFVRKTNDGSYMYMPSSTSPILNFYQQTNDNIANTTVPFAETVLESSPLNRALKQGSPGEDWQISNGHAKSLAYSNNSITDKIWVWTSLSSGLSASSYYANGTLSITSVTDEDGHVTREFENKTGQIVVSEKVIEGNAKLRTYFVFDDMGRLTHVVPPKTSSALADSPSVSIANDVLARECFAYQYDNRSRQIVKNIPGAGPQFIVYDKWDRVVLTQHANQRASNKWSFSKYDAFDRVIITGEISLQADQAGATQAVTDFYANIASTPVIRYEDSGGSIHGYTNRSYPIMANANQTLSVLYYDNYDFLTSFGSAFEFGTDSSFGLSPSSPRVKSLITGGKTLILGTTNYLRSAHYFDKNHRLIQVISDNHLGGVDKVSNTYDFTGKVLKTKNEHHGPQSVTVVKENVYDHAGRVIKTYHQVDSNPQVLLSANEYNEVGQLVEKNLYATNNGSTFKQSIDYRFNIRGWLSSVNNSQLSNDAGVTNDDANDLFGIQFGYNNDLGTGNTAQYNGNISAVKWSNYLGQSTTKERGYNFAYDPMNRLLASMHQEKAASWTLSNSYHETSTYDNNGNFLTINRISANGALLDNMVYDYGSGGNQPVGINDTGDKTKGFIDGNTSGNDFAYDANGNTIIDKNAGITTNITFNYLNLVDKVTNSNTGDYIRNIYDASGKKLSQQVYNISNVLKKKIDYVGEFFYQGDTLQFINHEEGRVSMKNGYEYQYFLKDHLGNNRVLFTTQPLADISTATSETANATVEQSKFLRYTNARRINSILFDHTNGSSTGYAQRLNGTTNERDGVARSMSVMPGDTVKMEVYAKYVDTNSSDWTTAFNTLMGQIATNNASVVIDGAGYSTSASSFPYAMGLNGTTSSTGTGPKAYMNWLFFDRNYVLKNGGYVRMSDVAKEYGQDCAHEKLASSFVATEPGYMYVYLSNENDIPLEVYFDDFKVTQAKSPLLEVNDYYGYGALMASSFTREASLFNRFKYNNKELITDLNLGWMDYGARVRGDFDPRFRTIDPLSERGRRWSPYAYVFDNPIRYLDPDGMWPSWSDIGDALDEAVNAAGHFVRGVGNAVANNNTTISSPGGSKSLISRGEGGIAYRIGQKVGDGLSAIQGVVEFGVGLGIEGGGIILDATGVGVVPGAALNAAGIAVMGHAANTGAHGAVNLLSTSGGGKTYETYTKPGPNGETYSGRTSGKRGPEGNVEARDAKHHMNDQGYGPAVLDQSSTNKKAIRGREQQLIEAHGGAQSEGGTSGNAINGISPNNPKKKEYIRAADKEFKPVKPPQPVEPPQ